MQQQGKASEVMVLEQLWGDFEINFQSDIFSVSSGWQSDEENYSPISEPDGSPEGLCNVLQHWQLSESHCRILIAFWSFRGDLDNE